MLTANAAKGPVPLHRQMQRGCIQYVKKILPSVEKRYASVVYSLRKFFIHTTHQTSVHWDIIRLKSFELRKIFTDELSAVYGVSLQHIRVINGLCPFSFVKRLRYPFCILLDSFQLTSTAPDNGEREKR